MEIIILCDQIDCKFNLEHKEIRIHYLNTMQYNITGKCTNPRPVIVTTFGKSLSSGARKCHSKSLKDDKINNL